MQFNNDSAIGGVCCAAINRTTSDHWGWKKKPRRKIHDAARGGRVSFVNSAQDAKYS